MWAFTQSGEVFIQHLGNLLFGREDCILDGALDITMPKFFWIDFRRIGWQELHMDFWMAGEISFHLFAAMGARTIPNQDKRLTNVATKMLQALNHFFGIGRTFKMLLVDVACDGQARQCGNLPTIFSNPLQVRRLSARRPSRTHCFGKRDPKFIFKNDFCAEPPRFFLSYSNLC